MKTAEATYHSSLRPQPRKSGEYQHIVVVVVGTEKRYPATIYGSATENPMSSKAKTHLTTHRIGRLFVVVVTEDHRQRAVTVLYKECPPSHGRC